jgi:hypothetical protein
MPHGPAGRQEINAKRPPTEAIPRSLGDLLKRPDSGSALESLARRARQQLSLWEHVQAALPSELRPAVQSCHLRPDGTLVLTATTPAWAARLRFSAGELLACCKTQYPAAETIKVRVATETGAAD